MQPVDTSQSNRRRLPSAGTRRWHRLHALLAGVVLCACAPQGPTDFTDPTILEAPAPSHAERASIADRLYFGRSIPGGGTVSDEEWNLFLRDVVTPRFPQGLTAWRAEGQWQRSTNDVVREPSFVLELIHPADEDADARIREIVEEYRRRFRQDAVLHVRDQVQVGF